MGRDIHKAVGKHAAVLPQTPKKQKNKAGAMKEEISMELAEIGNLNPKHEPMTPNQRQKSESERTYR